MSSSLRTSAPGSVDVFGGGVEKPSSGSRVAWGSPSCCQNSMTSRAGTRPARTSAKQSLISSSFRPSATIRVRPAACRAKTSARSCRVPTIEPDDRDAAEHRVEDRNLHRAVGRQRHAHQATTAVQRAGTPDRTTPGETASATATSAPPSARIAATGIITPSVDDVVGAELDAPGRASRPRRRRRSRRRRGAGRTAARDARVRRCRTRRPARRAAPRPP